MTEYMKRWLNTFNTADQFFASNILSMFGFVQDSERRTVCDENIRMVRYQIPMFFYFRTALAVKGPIEEPGLNRASPDADTFYSKSIIIQIKCIVVQLCPYFT